MPVYQTSTFIQEAPGWTKALIMPEPTIPPWKVLEDLVAKLERGNSAFAFATGLAAIDSVLKLLSTGDEILAVDDIYGGLPTFYTRVSKLGIKVTYVDTTEVANVAKAITSRTKLVWIESPTNPTLKFPTLQPFPPLRKVWVPCWW